MRDIVGSIEAEYGRYKALAEGAMAQLSEKQLHARDCASGSADEAASADDHAVGNSVAIIAWHVGGNLASRFTDFLTEDGEKPWRDRDSEFVDRGVGREELLAHWQRGWKVLSESLRGLEDDGLGAEVRIRGRRCTVHEALHRSLAHTSYHVGQIVLLARRLCADRWQYLSIAPGESRDYNEDPVRDRPGSHASALHRKPEAT